MFLQIKERRIGLLEGNLEGAKRQKLKLEAEKAEVEQ